MLCGICLNDINLEKAIENDFLAELYNAKGYLNNLKQ